MPSINSILSTGINAINDQLDWRSETSPSDLLVALNSYYSYDDHTGRAAIYEHDQATKPLDIDLIVTGIDLNLDEHIQVTEHIGDTFGIICFGKAPLQVTYSGVLVDSQKTFGKQYLIDAYKNTLRLSAVARTGKVPLMQFATHYIKGPFISLRLNESSESEDTITVVLSMIVTELKVL